MAEKNDYIKNSFWALLEKAARIISGILVGVLVARYLGKDQFGLISYALSVLAIFTVISTLGLDGLVVREVITRPDKKYEIMGTAFSLRFLGSFVVILLASTYSYFRDTDEQFWIVVIVSISIFFQSWSVIDFYFQSQVKGRLIAINQVITLLISAIVKLVFIYINAPVQWFAAMAAFEAILTMFNQLIFYKQQGEFTRNWFFTKSEAKILFISASPIILSIFMQMLYQKADQILILRYLRDIGLVGQYAAAIRISEASFFIPVALSAALLPGIIKNRNNEELQLKRLTQIFSLMIWSALIISMGGLIFGDWVIQLLYKDKFDLAPAIFKIHILITIPVFLGTAWGSWLLAINKLKILTIFQALVLPIAIGLEMYCIPRWGVFGAAKAIVSAFYISIIFMCTLYKPKLVTGLFIAALNPRNIVEIFTYWKENRKAE